jgi:hypothetical protein
MNTILKKLKPTPLLGILLLLILLLQGTTFVWQSGTYSMDGNAPNSHRLSFGIGGPLSITTIDGSTTYDINWLTFICNLACCYILAAILSRVFTNAAPFRRPALVCAVVTLVMIAASFCAAVGISKAYWGYYFARPAVVREVEEVTSVTAVIPVETESDGGGTRKVTPRQNFSVAECLAHGRNDPYYCLVERLLLALDEKKLLPSGHTVDMADLPALFPLIQKTGILARSGKGYEDSDVLGGVVIDAVDKSGRRIVFLGLTGRQVSNDHYPYYEMVFSGSIGSPDLSYVRGQHFFYDLAGIEGVEWYGIWLFFALPAVFIGILAVTAVMPIWRVIKRKGKARWPSPTASHVS